MNIRSRVFFSSFFLLDYCYLISLVVIISLFRFKSNAYKYRVLLNLKCVANLRSVYMKYYVSYCAWNMMHVLLYYYNVSLNCLSVDDLIFAICYAVLFHLSILKSGVFTNIFHSVPCCISLTQVRSLHITKWLSLVVVWHICCFFLYCFNWKFIRWFSLLDCFKFAMTFYSLLYVIGLVTVEGRIKLFTFSSFDLWWIAVSISYHT